MRILSIRRILFWGGFAICVCIAFAMYWDASFFEFNGTERGVRLALLVTWLAFTAYSLYCIPHESLWQSAQAILKLFWGRQVTADLYISVILSMGLVYLVTGSILETLLWSLFFLPFANLAILLFLILHVEDIVRAFGLN